MPPRLFIKPSGGDTSDSTIVTLRHPKTGVPTRFLIQAGHLHAITRISTPHITRSLFVGQTIISDGSIYLATPEDPLFHLLPILQKHTTQHSLPLPDIHDLLPPPLQKCTPQTLIETLCQCTKSTTPEFVPDTYKLCREKVLRILVRKVDALVPVLGGSLVDEFVEKRLALVIGQDPPSNISVIRDLARRRCAMDFISANLSDHFSSLLAQSTDFTELTAYLVHLDELRAAAMAAALSIPGGMGEGKRGAKDELEGDKKKKAKNVSQGVKALEKVSTRGMKDMRSFFSKKPAAKVKA